MCFALCCCKRHCLMSRIPHLHTQELAAKTAVKAAAVLAERREVATRRAPLTLDTHGDCDAWEHTKEEDGMWDGSYKTLRREGKCSYLQGFDNVGSYKRRKFLSEECDGVISQKQWVAREASRRERVTTVRRGAQSMAMMVNKMPEIERQTVVAEARGQPTLLGPKDGAADIRTSDGMKDAVEIAIACQQKQPDSFPLGGKGNAKDHVVEQKCAKYLKVIE